MTKKSWIASLALAMAGALFLTACVDYKTPGVSKEPSKMSADKLCFDYASSKDAMLGAEITARGLDCAAILRDDPLVPGGRELDAANRMGR